MIGVPTNTIRNAALALILPAVAILAAPTVHAQASAASSAVNCKGKTFNAMSDPDWNNLYPIVIMGVSMGPNSDPPSMAMPPICVCPGIYDIPSPGISVSYWQPLYISEVVQTAGCSPSLGGKELLPEYTALSAHSGFFNSNIGGADSSKVQLHWYEYPVFGMLDEFKDLVCRGSNGFNLAYVTEVDPTWQNDSWAAVLNPEAALFTSNVAQLACSADSVAANIAFPLDPLFWCAGSWGGVYPFSGTANQSVGVNQRNNLVLSKFLARQARLGLAFQTVGPDAICTTHPNPIWIKSEYRLNQVYPVPLHGAPQVIGALPEKQFPPVTNPPGMADTVNLIWQGQECCVRTY